MGVFAGCQIVLSTVNVPDVVGLTQAAAESAVTGVGLTVGTVTEQYSDTVPAGQVISQNPASGTRVAPGTAVGLVVSLGSQPGPLLISEKSVSVTPGLIADTGLSPDQFVVESLLSQVNLGAKNAAIQFADVDKGQIALVTDAVSGKTILAVYVTPQEIATGTFAITAESAAKALVLFNPYVMILTHEERETLLSLISTHRLYADLVAAIQDALAGNTRTCWTRTSIRVSGNSR